MKPRVQQAPESPPANPWVAAIAIVAVWALLYAPQLFGGRIFVGGDWPIYAPFGDYSAERWSAHHQRTFWNPYVFLGIPAAASLADWRPQYLPGPALDLLAALGRGRLWPPIALPMLSHLAGMLSAAWLVRRMWGLSSWAMAWAGVAYGLMPNLVVPFGYGHHAQLVSTGLMPVALLAIHSLFAATGARGALRAAMSLALTIAVQTLAGHPQFVYYSLLLSAAFAVERALHFSRPRRLAAALAAAALGLAMATAVWWPMALYGENSMRGLAGGVLRMEVALYSIGLADFLAFAWPHAVGFGGTTYWGGMDGTDYPQYFGVLVLLLFALAGMGGARRDGAAITLAAAASVSAALALGPHVGPLYVFVHEHVPLWSRLRVAVAVLIVAQLSAALLSARGLNRMLTGAAGRPPRVLVAIAAAAVLAVMLLALAPGSFEAVWAKIALRARAHLGPSHAQEAAHAARLGLIVQCALAAGAAMLLALTRRRGRAARVAAPALVVLLAVDLGIVTLPILRAVTGTRDQLAHSPPTIARLTAAEPRARASAWSFEDLTRTNEWMRWGAAFAGGSHGTPPLLWSQLEAGGLLHQPAVDRALAIRYVAVPPGDSLDPRAYERVAGVEAGPPVWRVRGALPRAYLVPRVEAPGNDIAVLRSMARNDSFPERVAFAPAEGIAGEYPGSGHCALDWIEDSPDRLVLHADAPDRAFLVVADAWFPGWSAKLDGGDVPLLRVDHLLRGIVLPPGAHQVTMEYLPAGWKPAVAASGVAAAVWTLLTAASWIPISTIASRRATP